METEQVSARISEFASEACVELFGAYGIHVVPTEASWQQSDEPLLSAAIGFVGKDLHATCLLVAEQGPILGSRPAESRLRDWIGELANQLVGRLKMRLLACGVNVTMTTPLVLTGIRLAPLPFGTRQPTAFASDSGGVLVWIELEAAPGFAFGSVQPLAHDVGDLLLF